jgi:methylated-DNA-[protein]-cysteine S-methyltransferase
MNDASCAYALFDTPIGACGIAWRGDKIIASQLPEETPVATAARLARRAGATEGEPPPSVERAIASIIALLEGARTDLSFIACDFEACDPFARQVYAATRAIPAGETSTYGAIAAQLGDKLLAQRVGQALGRNPFPIIVPCHRVLGASAKLTGFSAHGGVETKRRMLAIEGASLGAMRDLFDDLPNR